MKKILLLAAIAFSMSANIVLAQTTYPTVPLYGTLPNSDRTYRALQLGQAIIVDTNSVVADTVTLIPGFVSGAGAVFAKDYYITVTDSAVLAIRDVSSSYVGSTITFYITTPNASSWVKFLGYSGFPTSQWLLISGTTKVSLTASHYFVITFVQTGGKWIQKYPSAQD